VQSGDLAAVRVSPEEVRAELTRVLRSDAFSKAASLGLLLQHLVERTLDGTADQLKEYSIGVDVFARGESFDPRIDTIVRVQARRLRARLKEYYRSDGQFDPIVIEIPTGRYGATFASAYAAVRSVPSGRPPGAPSGGSRLRLAASTAMGRHALPKPRTVLIGRDRELETLTGLLRDPGVRLVTLTGVGGSGKTRLALQAAEALTGDFEGGVLLLPLAPLVDTPAVLAALAQLVGLRHTGGRPVREALRHYVSHSLTAPTLLVLDNFEHVMDAAPFVADVLDASPAPKVLVTSRAVLRVYGEHECPVPPLDVPNPAAGVEAVGRNPAVRLFAQRARGVDPAFELTDGNAPAVARICRRLDGLPLALELAAARIKLFPVEGMLPRLTRSLDFLTNGPRDVPPRQQTLRGAIDWSHSLLAEPEQRLFRRLAVFAGGCTLEGAEAVCDASRDLGIDVLAGMKSLVDNSLIQPGEVIGGETRFTMLETLREYALERLAPSGEETATRRAHAAYCIVLAEEGIRPRNEAERETWLARCDSEVDNFRAALDWLVASGSTEWALRLGVALYPFWEHRELLEEARWQLCAIVDMSRDGPPTAAWAQATGYAAAMCEWQGDVATAGTLFSRALEACQASGDARGEAAQLTGLAVHHRFSGDHAEARAYAERALDLCRTLGDPHEIAAALSNLAGIVSLEGDHAKARALLWEAHRRLETIGDSVMQAWTTNHLGDIAHRSGDLPEARRLYGDALDSFVRAGDVWGIARSAADLAQTAGELGDHVAARELFHRALSVFQSIDHKRGIAGVLEGMAVLALQQHQTEHGLTLAAAAAGLRLACGAAPRAAERAALDRRLAPAWESLGRRRAQEVWEAALRLPPDDAVRLAFG
jgi:predicted ATPase